MLLNDTNETKINNNTEISGIDLLFPKSLHVLINILYSFLILLAVTVNGSVVTSILRRRNLHTPMNYLLLNLSIADIIGAIGLFPYVFITNVRNLDALMSSEVTLCALSDGMQIFFTAAGVALLTLCAIAHNRYMAIKYPLTMRFRLNLVSVWIFNISSWLLSLAVLAPSLTSFKYSETLGACVRSWGNIHTLAYRTCLLLITFMLPASFLVITYCSIWRRVRKVAPIMDEKSHQTRNRMTRRAEKLVRILMLNFVICWTPFFMYWGLSSFSNFFQANRSGQIKKMRWVRIAGLFLVIQMVVEPLVYISGNTDLSSDIRRVAVFFCPFMKQRIRINPMLPTMATSSKDRTRPSRLLTVDSSRYPSSSNASR